MQRDGVEPKPWVLRLFAGSWALIFAAVAALLKGGATLPALWLVPLGVALVLAGGLLVPAAMCAPYRLVERLLAPVGRLFALLSLAIVYFGVFAPFALGLRLLGWDPLRRQRRHQKVSAWVARPEESRAGHYYWQY